MCPTVTSQDKQDSHTEQQTYFLPSLHFIFQYQEVLLFVVHTYILASGMHDKIYCFVTDSTISLTGGEQCVSHWDIAGQSH